MVTKRKDGTKRKRSRSQKFRKAVLGRPQGVIQRRVQAVGPEKFGVVAIDCAKARSKWMLVDFYGNVLSQPANVEHNRNAFQLAVLMLKQAVEKHDLRDVIVAVEMTGTYHKPPMRAFREAGFETRLVHPASIDSRNTATTRPMTTIWTASSEPLSTDLGCSKSPLIPFINSFRFWLVIDAIW